MSTFSSSHSGSRFAHVDSNHHGAILWILSSLSLTYFMLSCIVRLSLSYRNFTRDVGTLLLATVFGFLQVMMVYVQLTAGYGTAIGLLQPRQIITIQKYGYTANILYIAATTFAKISVVLLEARLTPSGIYQRICTILATFCATWGISGVFALAVKCNPAEPWITVAADCPNILLRWQIISASEVVIEVSIFAAIIGLVYNLQMARTKKFAVVLGFAFRLPLIALIMLHLHEVQDTIGSTNSTFDYIPASAIMSIQLGWSLVSATIVRLKSFVENLGSGYLGATLNTNLGSFAGTGSQSASRDARRGGIRDDVFEMHAVRCPETAANLGSCRLTSNNPRLEDDNPSIGTMTRVSNDGSQEFMVRKREEETRESGNVN